jgi:hypothetical protein
MSEDAAVPASLGVPGDLIVWHLPCLLSDGPFM